MALTALKGKRLTKKAPRAKARAGISAIPMDKGFKVFKWQYHIDADRKEITNSVKSYVKKNFKKSEVTAILANPEYKFYTNSHYGAIAYWLNNELPEDTRSKDYEFAINKYLNFLVTTGTEILKDKVVEDVAKIVSISPMERLQKKISDTVMQDLLDLEDQWIDGEKATIDLYKLFQSYSLSGSATLSVRKVVEGWLLDYEDAYHKRDEQAVEGYAHLKRPELNRRIKACQEMLLDLDKIKSAAKAVRKIRVKQPKAADKQVSKVKYLKEDLEFKLASINPIQMVGKVRLYTFNTKTRMLTEYITQSINGFEFSGTSIKNIDNVNSRTVKLRKPDEFLQLVLNKTPKQIDTEWKKLTTKTSVPNGRLNIDTILLRAMDK